MIIEYIQEIRELHRKAENEVSFCTEVTYPWNI